MGDHAATAGTGQTITLGKAFIIYLINVGVVSLLIFLASIADFFGGVSIVAYFIAGLVMNRIVLRNLIEFHPMYNTLQYVFQTKVRAMIFWPIQYLVLITKIGVSKVI
jgi:hypothetical protein